MPYRKDGGTVRDSEGRQSRQCQSSMLEKETLGLKVYMKCVAWRGRRMGN
jgi:hypothetical protein